MKINDHILVTGAAGFIGFHLCKRLIEEKKYVIGLDNINNYYDIELKKSRLKILSKLNKNNNGNFKFIKCDLVQEKKLIKIFEDYEIKIVINLAAQAGVRYSLKNPKSYIDSNLVGFGNLLECCKNFSTKNFIFASSSSVYGGNENYPFSEIDNTDHPLSIYAATKKSNELMAHSYSHLYNIPSIGVRFFTVYGSWGRPDMAPMIFARNILNRKPIKIFNKGDMWRDFTHIDDVINSIFNLIDLPANPDANYDRAIPDPSSSWAPYKIFNLGNGTSINLLKFIEVLENEIGVKAIKEFHEIQKGDVIKTFANNKSISEYTKINPQTNIKEGIKEFITWYKSYYEKQ